MRNALTIDLEDWYHPELVRHRLPTAGPEDSEMSTRRSDAQSSGFPDGGERADEWGEQIEQSTQLLLNLLRERGTKATFFVVGEIARRHPRLLAAIVEQGHELACHGMSHRPLWQMTPHEFRAELREFAQIASGVVPGAEVIGFRAPTFSLDNRTRWALGILTELGYRYDSSIFPAKTPVYGVSNGPLVPYRPSMQDVALTDQGGALVEFPMSVWTWAGLRVPVCGGFYLRALPFGFIKYSLRQINQSRPFTIYVHPWETCPDTPRLALPLVSRFVTYYNIGAMMHRLVGLLDAFSFAPMRTVLEEMGELGR
jgi:polysaccharide deacetylase family protein (PEP-CTERM system associated)